MIAFEIPNQFRNSLSTDEIFIKNFLFFFNFHPLMSLDILNNISQFCFSTNYSNYTLSIIPRALPIFFQLINYYLNKIISIVVCINDLLFSFKKYEKFDKLWLIMIRTYVRITTCLSFYTPMKKQKLISIWKLFKSEKNQIIFLLFISIFFLKSFI